MLLKILYLCKQQKQKLLLVKTTLSLAKLEVYRVKIRALFTGCDLTEGKIYDVIFEYDTVYELKCDTGQYCRPKTFFEIVDNEEESLEK